MPLGENKSSTSLAADLNKLGDGGGQSQWQQQVATLRLENISLREALSKSHQLVVSHKTRASPTRTGHDPRFTDHTFAQEFDSSTWDARVQALTRQLEQVP